MSTIQETSENLLRFCGDQKYATIYADPPWRFQNRTGKVAPEHKRLNRYETMELEDIMALPVAQVAAEKSHLYLWVPNALLPDGLAVMKAWGFEYKGNIIWEKVRKDGEPDGRGVGFYFRNVTEILLFGVRGGGFQAPAVNALYPEIVPREHLLRINGINQMANNVLLLLSPAAGGAILGMFGMQWTFLVDLLTAVIAIAIMFRLKIVTRAADRSDSSVLKELREGVRYTWSQPLLRVMLVCYAVTFILITPAAFLSPLMVVRSFGSEVWKLTANEMLWSLGALLGGAFVAWKGEFKNKITMIAVSLAVFGCTFALMGLSRVFWVYLIFDCICGMFVPVLIASETVLIQTNTEKGYMGRVFALLQFVSQGMMPIAILGFGPLSDLVRIESIMIGCGLLLICWSLYFKKAAGRALCSI